MIPTILIRIIKLDEKKYMINSRGFFMLYAVMRALMPNAKKNSDKRAIRIFFPHRAREPI
ncbi:MAG: hypothetical protein ABSE05_10925 [Syntrophales bacterium]|jgi:hypothetical protein